jgi:hypothetical protein
MPPAPTAPPVVQRLQIEGPSGQQMQLVEQRSSSGFYEGAGQHLHASVDWSRDITEWLQEQEEHRKRDRPAKGEERLEIRWCARLPACLPANRPLPPPQAPTSLSGVASGVMRVHGLSAG